MAAQPDIDKSFYAHLAAEDELGVVIRAHVHIEASINDFIDSKIPYPDLLPRIPYEGRLRLANALGLEKSHFDALKLLGDIRNSFGHNVNAELTDKKINELYSKLPSETQKTITSAYEKTNKDHALKNMPAFNSLSAKERFMLIAVALKMFVATAAYKRQQS